MTDSPGDKFIQEQPLKALNVRKAMNQQFNMTTVRPCVLMYCNCYITACARHSAPLVFLTSTKKSLDFLTLIMQLYI